MSICTSNLTSGFIDLATYDELEKYMYGGPDATAYFVRETRKATWFTQVPTVLSRASGTPDFGQTWSVSISRAGDYLLNTWLRVLVPRLAIGAGGAGAQATLGAMNNLGAALGTGPAQANELAIAWVQNLMHNLVSECCITFNDLVAARFDSLHLDFWAAFTVPASKQQGYNNMIGNTALLTQAGSAAGGGTFTIPGALGGIQTAQGPVGGVMLNLPLPFFYARDSGVALPTAALPYNDMRITFTFRPLVNLLQAFISNGTASLAAGVVPVVRTGPVTLGDITGGTSIPLVQVWAEYAIVSNDERKRMACAPRDILIEQVQTAPLQGFNPATNQNPSFDVRFSHAIKVLFFAVVNITGQHTAKSCYGTDQPFLQALPSGAVLAFGAAALNAVVYQSGVTSDPITQTSLIYENTARLATMGSDYFSLVDPYYHSPVIPVNQVGLHMYSYSLDFICLDPLGSTNYGKLTNVSMVPAASNRAQALNNATIVAGTAAVAGPLVTTAGNPIGPTAGLFNAARGNSVDSISAFCDQRQQYQFVVTAINNNIIRISGGALGFPVL